MTDPRFVENPELVAVAFVANEMEGEMIRGLLDGVGIPSMLQGVGMAEGTRYGLVGGATGFGIAQKVMVHAHRLEEAGALIASTVEENELGELS